MFWVNCFQESSEDGVNLSNSIEYEYRTYDKFKTFEEAKKHVFKEYTMDNMEEIHKVCWINDWVAFPKNYFKKYNLAQLSHYN